MIAVKENCAPVVAAIVTAIGGGAAKSHYDEFEGIISFGVEKNGKRTAAQVRSRAPESGPLDPSDYKDLIDFFAGFFASRH